MRLVEVGYCEQRVDKEIVKDMGGRYDSFFKNLYGKLEKK